MGKRQKDMKTEPPDSLRGAFARRPVDANKRSVGTVTVVGGSVRYAHAPVIAGLGARAAGAGLVQLVVPGASRIAAGALLPEATFTRLAAAVAPPKADVAVVGMGLGVSEFSDIVVSSCFLPRRGVSSSTRTRFRCLPCGTAAWAAAGSRRGWRLS